MSITNDGPHQVTAPVNYGRALAKTLLTRTLKQVIRSGAVQIELPDGSAVSLGKGSAEIGVRLHDWKTIFRLVINPDLALGESYMDGTLTFDQGNIHDLLDLCLANSKSTAWMGLLRRLRVAGRRLVMNNPIGQAQKNVAHHYDLSDELFELFLDEHRQYSCAYFARPDMSIDQAQDAKIRHIATKLLLKPGQRLLDIGSGWGGLGLALARRGQVNVTGVTLSVEQKRYAEAEARRQGMSDRVRFQLLDYRKVAGKFERIVSVGMFEHVGAPRYGEYFNKIAGLLTEEGVALVHTIARVQPPSAPHPWIRKYIFPGGYIPSLSEITPAIENSGLLVTDMEVLRLHYAETLKIWRERFVAKWDKAAKLYDDRFCRMWEFYLASSEASFRHNGLVVVQIQLARNQSAVSLVRDYMSG
ncbi:MAG: SAM-dependent methyltransferase [Marinosulfonomonas sp.]|nr:MAG: SAM-dependent methyltransferase [Marinosulfonomonas sp.]